MTSNATDVSTGEGDAADPIRVTTDELAVEKVPAVHSDDAVKIVFTIAAQCDRPVEFRIRDPLPDEIEPEAIGFHHEYDRDSWHVAESGHVVYEGVIEPGTERETLYGALVSSLDQLDLFLDPPSFDTTRFEPPNPTSSEGSSEVDGDPHEDAEPATVDRVGDEAAASQEGTGSIGEGVLSDASIGGTAPGAIDGGPKLAERRTDPIEALVDELRDRELAEEERSLLRTRLGLDSSNSVEVRLRHVQNQVDDLVAYRDALEGFIDENGETTDILDEFRGDIAAIDEAVEGVDERLASLDDEVSDVAARLDELEDAEGTIETLADEVDELRSTVGSLDRRHDADVERLAERTDAVGTTVEETRESVTADLAALREDVARCERWREQLSDAIRFDPGGETGVAGD